MRWDELTAEHHGREARVYSAARENGTYRGRIIFDSSERAMLEQQREGRIPLYRVFATWWDVELL